MTVNTVTLKVTPCLGIGSSNQNLNIQLKSFIAVITLT